MNLFIAGFRGTYRPTAPPNLGLEDNRPDVHDEADFDIPNTQAVLERFMSNMSKLADDEYQSLSDLLDSLPDPSSYTTAKTMTAAAPRENGVVQRSRVFMDFLSMDGDEVSTATMCPTTQCASCWCPREQLHDSDHVFPFRDTQEIRAELETEQAQLLNQDGTARDRCKDRVSF